MPQIIKKEDGTEEEVFSAAEIDTKLKEKETELTAGFQAKQTELDTALSEKKKLEDQIAAGGGGQAANFKTLKDALDKKDADIAELRTTVQNEKESRTNEFISGLAARITGGNKELEKKVLHHFKETLKSVNANTQEEISKKLESAYKLSVDSNEPGILDTARQGAGGRGYIPPAGSGPVEFTAAEKSLGSKMGITEEDYKKYGQKLHTKRSQ